MGDIVIRQVVQKVVTSLPNLRGNTFIGHSAGGEDVSRYAQTTQRIDEPPVLRSDCAFKSR